MTATDVLRRLLDERGVEYETYIELPTGFEHVKWNFNEHGSADFNVEFGSPWLTMYGVISGPEQAIAATLGSSNCTDDERTNGTCRNVADDGFECSECKSWWTGPRDTKPPMLWGFKYCPRCGRKVVSE